MGFTEKWSKKKSVKTQKQKEESIAMGANKGQKRERANERTTKSAD